MKYYTTKEVSNILNLSIKTIQKLIRTKKLSGFKVRGQFLVEESDLKLFIENNRI